jgi:alkylation response protein AidB-like acyl-CoA dehydrogenase
VVFGGGLVQEAGSDAQKSALLQSLSAGRGFSVPAVIEPGGDLSPDGIRMTARQEDDRFVLDGVKQFVRYADSADTLICALRTLPATAGRNGISLLLVPRETSGMHVVPVASLAGEHHCDVYFENVAIPQSALLGPLHGGWPVLNEALRHATLVQCAEIVGAVERVLELMIAYAQDRVQFGRPIGAFQAVQHKLVNVLRDLECARAATYAAAAALNDGHEARDLVAAAKAAANTVARAAAYEGHQVFAAIGFSAEHDMQLYSRRLKWMELHLGGGDAHRRAYAAAIGLN